MSVAELEDPSAAIRSTSTVNPFKFLAYYEEADAHLFAGRDKDVHQITDAIVQARMLVLYGKSGLGKTSLLLAGVFPELRERGLLPIHVRTLRDPVEDIQAAVAKELEQLESPRTAFERLPGAQGWLEFFRNASEARPLALVLDQFEEFFVRFGRDPHRYREFVDAIAAIARDRDLRVSIVFSIREDFLADLDDFRAFLPNLFENEYRLRPMTAFGVRESITRPLEVQGIAYDTRLVARLVDELSTRRFDSVMLQLLCRAVYEHASKRSGPLCLTEEDLRRTGDLDDVFRHYLDEMASAITPASQLHVRVVLKALMTQERTKQAMRVSDFARTAYRLADDEVASALHLLEKHRLLRVDRRGDDCWYELIHERLVPILDYWIRLDKQFNALIAAHDLVTTPVRNPMWRDARRSLLSSGWLSDVIGPFRERLQLADGEVEYVLWSAILHRHPDVAFWAERYGVARSWELVHQKLEDPDWEFRAGAAFAAGRIAGVGADAKRTLFDVALHDTNAEVRREAARAMGADTRVVGNAAIAEALRRVQTRQRALEALAEMYANGAELPGHSLRTRWLARKVAEKRVRKERRLELGDAGQAGLWAAVAGGLTWGATVLSVYGLVFACYEAGVDGGSILDQWSPFVWASLFLIVPTGSALAYAGARRVLVRAVLRRPLTWTSVALWGLLRVFLVVVVVVAISAAISAKKVSATTVRDVLAYLAVLGVTLAAIPIMALMIGFAERSTRPGPMPALVLRSLLASAGLPVLAPGIIFWIATKYNTGAGTALVSFAIAASGFTATLAAGLGRAACKRGEGGERVWPWAFRAQIAMGIAAFAGAVAWVGLDGIPALGEIMVRRSSETLKTNDGDRLDISVRLTRSAAVEQVVYRRLIIDGHGDYVRARVESSGAPVYLDGLQVLSRDILLTRGSHLVSFHGDRPTASKLSFLTAPPLADGIVALFPGQPSSYLWLRWIPYSEKELRATLEGRAPAGVPNVVIEFEKQFIGNALSLGAPPMTIALVYCNGDVRSHTVESAHEIVPPAWLSTRLGDAFSCEASVAGDGSFHVDLRLSGGFTLYTPSLRTLARVSAAPVSETSEVRP